MTGARTAHRLAMFLLGCFVCAGLAAPTGHGHPMPSSVLAFDIHQESVDAELQLPVDDLSLASGIDLRRKTAPAALASAEAAALRDYLGAHVKLTGPDGRRWTTRIGDLHLDAAEQADAGPYRELIAYAVLTPPPGSDTRRFTVAYDAIIEKVVTHEILVSVTQNWSGGRVESSQPQQVGVIRVDPETMSITPVFVDVTAASGWSSFIGMIALGAGHILSGTDHSLFLLTLLLLAPLTIRDRGWRVDHGFIQTLRRAAAITLAFTVGHSVALAASAASRFEAPRQLVEILIAATILLTGIHAIRPILQAREAAIAAMFGLIHGLSFAFTLNDLHLSTTELAVSLLGFNLGVEAIQMLIVIMALPPFLLVLSTRWHNQTRIIAAAMVIVAATAWLLDRAGWPNALATSTNNLTITPAATSAAVLLSAFSACLLTIRYRRTGTVDLTVFPA